ncbi:helix-turn-helix transcriptional regulator [Lactococcus formosensis]|uniref:Helix-turn-helix transcriptional regulator n=1 Tax=Lactococcus formosensis TaxID=1281486 RepID=A0A9X4NZQ9_9LACT|nr:helix-turn-helix transcriptional regulator [Lactococcus formosensis]MDG6126413.1 helix-turn-helix transcriptional regulator [Lactococcus formosensis]MDG6131899.1 helix-turn-helix transcriptional regulator [Lactococcus formosensis]MDG6133896.1 helix-turn-helix transcriptional regulator [Lactococcus formosensis]MDG6140478.1 helix-turn-helix transcriptional regulator [Lactococcus formosensis]MDG6145020.1 helix-turn-helix transcriptional regulator [Lactococcus formosensis]
MINKLPPQITLKAARINAGLTAKEVGNKVHKHYQTILAYEKDSTDISMALAQELANIYSYPLDYIFLGKNIVLKQFNEAS